MSDREKLLADAASVIAGDRDAQYGGPEDSFRVISEMWNAYLSARDNGHPLEPDDVAAMMTLVKVARLGTGGTWHRDTWLDIAGYAGCGWEVANRNTDASGSSAR